MEEIKDEIVFIESDDTIREMVRKNCITAITNEKLVMMIDTDDLKEYMKLKTPYAIFVGPKVGLNKRSQLFEMTVENCHIPVIFLTKEPEKVTFAERLGTKYIPLNTDEPIFLKYLTPLGVLKCTQILYEKRLEYVNSALNKRQPSIKRNSSIDDFKRCR